MSTSLNEAIKNFNQPDNGSTKVSDIIFWIIVVISLVILVLVNIYSFSEVSGESMMETVKDGDIVICAPPNRLERGDIVTAKVDEDKIIIKRLVALPGDRIIFRTVGDGKSPFIETVELYVDKGNGFEKVSEDYINGGIMTEYGFVIQTKFLHYEYELFSGEIAEATDNYIITLSDDEYFLLGDNRDNSTDSRSYGAFNKDNILGKVVKIARSDTGLHSFLDEVLFSTKRQIN